MGLESLSDKIGLWIFKNTKSDVFPRFVAYSRAPLHVISFNRVQHKLCCRICANHPESGWLAEKFVQNLPVENWIVRKVLRHKREEHLLEGLLVLFFSPIYLLFLWKSVWYWNRVYAMKENLLWFTEISGGRASCWKYNWRKRETLSLHARRVVQRNLAAKRMSHSAQSRRNISHESICTFQLRNFRLYMYKRQKE